MKPQDQTLSERKHAAILRAATDCFLKNGYLATNMEEIAAISAVSKQTVYKHFESKEQLFVEIVSSMTREAGDHVLDEIADPDTIENVEQYLLDYAMRQLTIVLTPPLMQLRRLVIGEVARFPDLARALYENGPERAIAALTRIFASLAKRDRLRLDEPRIAAAHFNWLIMAGPLNRAMLLGDESIPNSKELRRHAREGVRAFLRAYGPDSGCE